MMKKKTIKELIDFIEFHTILGTVMWELIEKIKRTYLVNEEEALSIYRGNDSLGELCKLMR